jgi:hypothetical protein
MEHSIKRSGLIVGLILSLLAALIVAMSVSSSPASASPFCGGQTVNSTNKCWGSARALSGATGYGESAGVCVGADLTQGTCAPAHQIASVSIGYGEHSPWITGTGGNTVVYGSTSP